MTSYFEKLKDPRWQKKRLEIFERDNWTCAMCGATEKTLHVHHGYYARDAEPWEYEDFTLTTVCADCHVTLTEVTQALRFDIGMVPAQHFKEFAEVASLLTEVFLCKPDLWPEELEQCLGEFRRIMRREPKSQPTDPQHFEPHQPPDETRSDREVQ